MNVFYIDFVADLYYFLILAQTLLQNETNYAFKTPYYGREVSPGAKMCKFKQIHIVLCEAKDASLSGRVYCNSYRGCRQ